jgi:hypothetical protein
VIVSRPVKPGVQSWWIPYSTTANREHKVAISKSSEQP